MTETASHPELDDGVLAVRYRYLPDWLLDESGNLALIDFKHARRHLPARDLVRLRFRILPSRPDLRDAFFDGYGRRLTDTEDELIWHLGALHQLRERQR